jgi:hypothetical protein
MGAGVAIAQRKIALIRFTGVGAIASDSKEKSGGACDAPRISRTKANQNQPSRCYGVSVWASSLPAEFSRRPWC